ncbi:MAG TPA: hypothetical protein VLS25_08745, partial [Dehalococcoidia bacterium]|nr:hypothetical protein [Dehalococcoidia bacterium]
MIRAVAFAAGTGFFIAVVAGANTAIAAATLHVPGDYPTIQAAIDAASNGDSVLVAAGTYDENIDFAQKRIVVESANGPVLTVIHGSQSSAVVTI